MQFTDENLRALFGAEAAEDEDPTRLKQYFFRNKAYESLNANLPIRILVGHKGIGKSALLKMAFIEDSEKDRFAIWIRPDDVQEIVSVKDGSFNERIVVIVRMGRS